MAVSLYLEEQLGMPADAVDGVLTPACREALTVSLDVDGNSEVCIHDMHRVEILPQPVISRDEKEPRHIVGSDPRRRSPPPAQTHTISMPMACALSGDGVGGEPSHGHARCARSRPAAVCLEYGSRRRTPPHEAAAGSQDLAPL